MAEAAADASVRTLPEAEECPLTHPDCVRAWAPVVETGGAVKGEYETQAFVARRDDTHRGFVWRCARCGRYIGVIEALDGSLEIMHKCGARNRLVGVVDPDAAEVARE